MIEESARERRQRDRERKAIKRSRRRPATSRREWIGLAAFSSPVVLLLLYAIFNWLWWWSEDIAVEKAIADYEQSHDIQVLHNVAVEGPYEALKISDYLIQGKHPLLVERYKQIDAEIESMFPDKGTSNYRAFDTSEMPFVRRDSEFLLVMKGHKEDLKIRDRVIKSTWPNPIDLRRLFESIPPLHVPKFVPKSLVYAYPGGRIVGTYTDGSSAFQPGLTAYVVDLQEKTILAYTKFQGGDPDETVANYRLFSSRTGSQVDLDEVKNWYNDLPLEQ